MFSRGFTKPVPRTYAACERYILDHSIGFKRYGFCKLGNNTELHAAHDHFYATFHGNCIVRFYPEYKVINACGHEGSPTTQQRIASLANVSMHSNSRCGFNNVVRVNGYPYEAGMRIDNDGHVIDKYPDKKTVNKKEGVQQYVALWRKIEKLIASRWAVGEWAEYGKFSMLPASPALRRIAEAIDRGETFLDHKEVLRCFGFHIREVDLKVAVAGARNAHRHKYYQYNDVYETLEITNG